MFKSELGKEAISEILKMAKEGTSTSVKDFESIPPDSVYYTYAPYTCTNAIGLPFIPFVLSRDLLTDHGICSLVPTPRGLYDVQ